MQGRDLSKLALFQRVEFLGPRRQIRTLLDSTAGFFARSDAGRFTVVTEFERPGEKRGSTTVSHDLAVFRSSRTRLAAADDQVDREAAAPERARPRSLLDDAPDERAP